MKPQSTLINEFIKGATEGEASHMYIEGDVLYSYGHHFPLLVRRDWGFLLNADKYSSTTSQHQSACFRHATIQVPFSALEGAGISFREFDLITHEAQRWDTIGYQKYVGKELETISVAEYEKLNATEQEGWYPQQERRPESAIIRFNGKCYLSSMDGYNFFICQLPEPADNIEEAFASLKPKGIGNNYVRQGEWFFVVADEMPIFLMRDDKPIPPENLNKFMYRAMTPKFTLPNKNPDGNLHIATRGMQIGNDIWVSGQVRHTTRWGGRGDHRMLRLSTSDNPLIFKAFENRALGSWSASGRVD
jgi:hypothetical protein